MRLLYINPNATRTMTDDMVAVAQAHVPQAEVIGWTNTDGPPSIQGVADGQAALPGILAMLPKARLAGADAIVIGCFDDTGLAQMRERAHCPVIGIGQAAYVTAALLGQRFSVVTTLDVSVPILRDNIETLGFAPHCTAVRASGISVLAVEEGSEETRARLAAEINIAAKEDQIATVVLGCAGMAPLAGDLSRRTSVKLIDGVAASAGLAGHLVQMVRPR